MGLTLTVYFDDPFWVGVFERMEDGKSREVFVFADTNGNPAG